MEKKRRGLAVIFHSGSYDRVYNGLTVALTALAQGRDVKLFFTYWSLEYLKRSKAPGLTLDMEGADHKDLIEKRLEDGQMKQVSELLADARTLGGKIYVCVGSMSLMNIARKELVDEIDGTSGTPAFLSEVEEDQLIFV